LATHRSIHACAQLHGGVCFALLGSVREEGRRTLKGTEEGVRFIIQNKAKEERGEDEGVIEKRAGREAVTRVREALVRMEKAGDGNEKAV
jgi:hypothetical protein